MEVKDDTISRQAAIDALYHHCPDETFEDAWAAMTEPERRRWEESHKRGVTA